MVVAFEGAPLLEVSAIVSHHVVFHDHSNDHELVIGFSMLLLLCNCVLGPVQPIHSCRKNSPVPLRSGRPTLRVPRRLNEGGPHRGFRVRVRRPASTITGCPKEGAKKNDERHVDLRPSSLSPPHRRWKELVDPVCGGL